MLKNSEIPGIISQAFPLRVIRGEKNMVYEIMNSRGYGVVSPYHTLIEPLRRGEFISAIELSEQVLNLPTHQDADHDYCEEMITLLGRVCEETDRTTHGKRGINR